MNGSAHILVAFCLCVFAATICGCASSKEQSRNMRQDAVQAKTVTARVKPKGEATETERQAAAEKARVLREMSENGWNNESALSEFALKESPKLWQTVQTIRAQIVTRRKGLARLKADLQEFDVRPESDANYRRLQAEIDSRLDGLASIFGNLEQAYIAAKKFELSPSSANHEQIMRRALEEDVKEADSMTKRYHEMKKER